MALRFEKQRQSVGGDTSLETHCMSSATETNTQLSYTPLLPRNNEPIIVDSQSTLEPDGTIKDDPDVYGIGFRAGYYILSVSNFLASFLCRQLMRDFRISSNFISAAVLVNTFYDATTGSLVLFEWYLVSWMTVGLSVFNLPLDGAEFDNSLGSLGSSWLIYGCWMIAQFWLYTAGRSIGNPTNRSVYVMFFWGGFISSHVAG